MKVLDLAPNTPEWDAHRANPNIFNASEAPAMMGVSPYMTREQLVKKYALGITDVVDAATQRRFDEGHVFEALARPLAEDIVGEELAAVVGIDGPYSASFDGITIDGNIIWEHKTLNGSIREVIQANGNAWGRLPGHYEIQMEHQLMVSGAEKCLFMATKWREINGNWELEDMRWCWYYPNMSLRSKIIAGWAVLADDVKNYKHTTPTALPVARTFETMPALDVSFSAIVQASNIDAFKTAAAELISLINTDLESDQDFADAEAAIKWLKSVEQNIDAEKEKLLSRMSDVNAVFKALDAIKDDMARQKRLQMEKLVKTRFESKMNELLSRGRADIEAYQAKLTEKVMELAGAFHAYPTFQPVDIVAAVKGKKSWATREAAVDVAIANGKAQAEIDAERASECIKALVSLPGSSPLVFPDACQLIQKPLADMLIIAQARIDAHKAAESEREAALQARAEQAAQARVARDIEQYTQPVINNSQDLPEPKQARPSNAEIISALSACFNANAETVSAWIKEVAESL